MVRKNTSEGQQPKTRGRPRKDAHKHSNAASEVLDDKGHDSSPKGGIIASTPTNTRLVNGLDKMNEEKEVKEEIPQLMDSIDIKEGNNEVRITLTRQKNRMIRLQVFFNGTELRPSTFTGFSAANNYWSLLKDKDHSRKTV